MKKIIKVFLILFIFVIFKYEINASEVPTYTCKYKIMTGNACTLVISGNTESADGFSITYENCGVNTNNISRGENVKFNKFRDSEGNAYCPKICSTVKMGQKRITGSYDFSTCTEPTAKYIEADSSSQTYTPPNWTEEVSNVKTCEIYRNGALAFTVSYDYSTNTPSYQQYLNCQLNTVNIESKITEYFKQFKNNIDAPCTEIKMTYVKHGSAANCNIFTSESVNTGGGNTTTTDETTGEDLNEGAGNQESTGGNSSTNLPNLQLGSDTDCGETLGPTMTKLIRILIDVLKAAGAIICTVKMMLTLVPAITSKDADALNKAIRTCITLLVILAVILLIDTLLVIIGRLFAFDLSCFK